MLRCGIFCNGVFFVVNAKSCLVVKYKKNKSHSNEWLYRSSAVRRGLEPLTPCVTGTYSNQLN